MTDPKLPAKRSTQGKTSVALDRIRNATPAKKIASVPSKAALRAAAVSERRPRLVFGIDATASREPAWEAAKKITDSLFTTLPGELDVALAVHGGGVVSMFSAFSSDVQRFRDLAAGVSCRAGHTQLVPLMQRTREHPDVKVFLYIGDCFEESEEEAYEAADALKARGIRAVMLHDASSGDMAARRVFEEIAKRTGGVCLDFYGGDRQAMKNIFEAVAVLAVGGIKLLQQRRSQLPGAAKLLPYLS